MVVLIVLGFLLCLVLLIFFAQGRESSNGSPPLDFSSTDPIPTCKTPASSFTKAQDFSALPSEFIVLDLETTGLDPERHEIIELGAIRANRDSDTHMCFQSLVKPKKPIPRKITQLTGITQGAVEADGRSLEEVFPEFLNFIGDLPLVTFNAAFDMRFLQKAALQHGAEVRNRYACALKMARLAWPGLPSYRLTDLAKLGNLSTANTHRAVGDCERTLIVFVAAVSKRGKRIRWSRIGSKASKLRSQTASIS